MEGVPIRPGQEEPRPRWDGRERMTRQRGGSVIFNPLSRSTEDRKLESVAERDEAVATPAKGAQ